MLNKTAIRAFLAFFAVLSLAAVPLMAQGVSRQDYSGLDKYLEQGRLSNSSFVGVRAAEFLTIPVGARGIGMGNAYTSIVDDISSIWWNPAGLGFLEQREAMVTVVDYTMDLKYSFGAVAFPIGDGNVVVGGFFGYLDIPDMEITTVRNPEGTGDKFRAYDFQMGGSLAYNFSDRFVGGINLKYVHQDMLSNIGGSAFAIDAGAVYHTDLADREIKFAFMIQNLGTNITMSGPNLLERVGPSDRSNDFPTGYGDYTTDPYALVRRESREMMIRTHTYRLPTTVKISLGYNLYTSEKANWLVVGEIQRPSYIPISYSAGTEVSYNFSRSYSGALRMGWIIQTDEFTDDKDQFGYSYYGDDPALRGLSIGGGIQRNFAGRLLRFNYAYRNKGRLSADNFFTVSIGF
ncbi:MAG: PorV/PorQ family protein [Gemmatimonadota bacterium]|nr:PorV/PorQ family protein [Gemmatimonadota bacterium]